MRLTRPMLIALCQIASAEESGRASLNGWVSWSHPDPARTHRALVARGLVEEVGEGESRIRRTTEAGRAEAAKWELRLGGEDWILRRKVA